MTPLIQPTHYQGRIEIPGLPAINVENLRGSIREGVDERGQAWRVVMPAHYGELAGTTGADGDPLDVFVGEDAYAPWIYVVHIGTEARDYDECKVFVGFPNASSVRECFQSAYSQRRGMKWGRMRKLSYPQFLHWLEGYGHQGVRVEAGHEIGKSRFEGVTALRHSYIERLPTGNPNHPWRYVYPSDKKPKKQAEAAAEGEKQTKREVSAKKGHSANKETLNSPVGRALESAGFYLHEGAGGHVDISGFGGKRLATVSRAAMSDTGQVSGIVSRVARENVQAIRSAREGSRYEARRSFVVRSKEG